MGDIGPLIDIETLLEHSRWVRGLARHLVGNDADDLVQDVWVAAATHPPREENPRGWLGRVILNRARSRSRAETRRLRRDHASADGADPPTTPEDAAARMEVHRLLATLVAELPEPYRHVIYLRYFEDREPVEIARLLELPPGTVRWRLTQARERLRTRLDERHGGDRSRWTLALMPITGRRTRPSWAVAGVSVAAVVTVLTVAGSIARVRPARVAGTGSPPAAVGRPAGPHRLGGLVAPVPPTPACPVLDPLRAQLAALRVVADPWRDPREVYQESAPNPTLEAVARPLFARLLAQAPQGCEHSVTCRGTVCEISLLVPEGMDPLGCSPRGGQQILEDYLSSGSNNLGDSGTPFHDPLKGASYTRRSLLRRFHRDDGAPVPRGSRPPLPPFAPDLGAFPSARLAGLSEGCRPSWQRLVASIEQQQSLLADMVPDQIFAAGQPNPALAARVVTWTAKVLDRAPDKLPFQVQCRASVCTLSPSSDDRDPLAIRWTCQEASALAPRRCFPRFSDRDWYTRLDIPASAIGRLRPPPRPGASAVPAYLVVHERDRSSGVNPWVAVIAFTESFDWRQALATCSQQFPERGKLTTRLDLPMTTGDEKPLHRVALHVGGALAGGKLAGCVSSAFTGASEVFTIPPVANGAVLYTTFTFPFDPAPFAAKIEELRRHLADDRKIPAL